MSTKYEPSIIQQLADKLYTQAAIIVFLWTVVVAGICGFAGYTYSAFNSHDKFALIGVLIGAIIGYLFGQSRAFQLRVLAQTALCQKQIEENTRPRRQPQVPVAVRHP